MSRIGVSMGLIVLVLLAATASAQETVSFATSDGGTIHADAYGSGPRAVVLAHGGRYDKESWRHEARELAAAGFRVLAIDFRGYGTSTGPGSQNRDDGPFHLDLLAAVRYLRGEGAREVAIVGASFGGGAAADAVAHAPPGEIDRLVLLASDYITAPDKLNTRTLFIVARDDPGSRGTPRLDQIRQHYDKAPGPKALVVLDGSAHAQAIFRTDQSGAALRAIIRFLSER